MGEVRLNARVTSAEGLRSWARSADYGDWCIYHEGNLGRDRIANLDLHERAELLMILAQNGFVNLHQAPPPFADSGVLCYMAIRTGQRYAPRSLLNGAITANHFSALLAVRDREVQQSASRAIREKLAIPDNAAVAVLNALEGLGLVERMPMKGGWVLTDEGKGRLK